MNNETSKNVNENSINGSNMIDKTRDGGLGHASSSAQPMPSIPQKPDPKPTKDKE